MERTVQSNHSYHSKHEEQDMSSYGMGGIDIALVILDVFDIKTYQLSLNIYIDLKTIHPFIQMSMVLPYFNKVAMNIEVKETMT